MIIIQRLYKPVNLDITQKIDLILAKIRIFDKRTGMEQVPCQSVITIFNQLVLRYVCSAIPNRTL